MSGIKKVSVGKVFLEKSAGSLWPSFQINFRITCYTHLGKSLLVSIDESNKNYRELWPLKKDHDKAVPNDFDEYAFGVQCTKR